MRAREASRDGRARDPPRDDDLGVVAASAEPGDLAEAMRAALDRVTGPDGAAWRRRIAALATERFGWPPAATAYRSLVRSLWDAGPGAPPLAGGSTSQST